MTNELKERLVELLQDIIKASEDEDGDPAMQIVAWSEEAEELLPKLQEST